MVLGLGIGGRARVKSSRVCVMWYECEVGVRAAYMEYCVVRLVTLLDGMI